MYPANQEITIEYGEYDLYIKSYHCSSIFGFSVNNLHILNSNKRKRKQFTLIQIHLLAKTFLHFLDFGVKKTKIRLCLQSDIVLFTLENKPNTASTASAYLVTVHIAIYEK